MSEKKTQNKSLKDEAIKEPETNVPKVRSWFMRLALEFGSVVLSLAIIWLAGLGILMNRPSVDLAFVKPHYEHWFSQAFDGKTTEIEDYSARWVQERRVIEVRAQGIHIRSEDGAEQIIKDIRGEFRIKDNILATPEIVRLNIVGGALTVIRAADKRIQVTLGTPETSGNVGAIWQSEAGASGQNMLGQIENVTVRDADIYFHDNYNDVKLDFANIDGAFAFVDDHILLDAVGVLSMDAEMQAAFSFALQTTLDYQQVTATLDVNNLIPARIAPVRGPVAILSRLDAPLDVNATIETGDKVGVQDLQLSLIAGAGRLKTGPTYKPFTHARIEAHYDAAAKDILVQAVEIESQALDIVAKGRLDNPAGGVSGFFKQPVGFDINIDAARLDPGSRFDGSLNIKPSTINGTFDLKENSLDFSTLALDFGTFKTDLSAGLKRDDDGNVTSLTADGGINGTINKQELLGFWPKDFALGARNWIENSLQAGDITNYKIHAALDENDIKSQQIANEHLNIKFDVNNGEVRYMRKMPWLRNAVGYGILQGNQADFFVTSGNVDGLTVKSGKVNIPKLSPHGGDFTIDLQGTGTVSEMLRVSNFQPFEFSKNYGIDPQSFKGAGAIDLHVTRPLLEHFDQSRILYELSGDFTGVSIPVGIGDFQLNDGQVTLQADKRGIAVSGPIKLGQWQTTLDWLKPLEYRNTPAKYTLVGTITRDDLDAFGIGLRKHFGGEVGLHISGEGDGLSVQQADIFANYTEADVNIGSLWHKPKGSDGKLSGRLVLAPGGGGRIENLAVKAEGLDIKGSVALAQNFRLIALDLPTAKIEGLIDAKVLAKPTDKGVLSLNLDGGYLNVEQWVKQAFKTQSSSVAAPINLSARLDKITLDENYVLTEAQANFTHTGAHVSHALLKGATKDGAFLAEIGAVGSKGASDQRNVRVEIPDASVAMLTLLGLNSIEGGKLAIDGKLPPSGEPGGLSGHVTLDDFTLVQAPAFAQILSLASLQGMADTLGGSGLKFNKLEMQFALEDGVLKVRDGRASGPALGLTGEGDIGIAGKTIDFSGVLVPSYTVNSILGDIPLLGDVMVGKKGEGMFAINYSVKGPFTKTQIAVNPLSALTPGFLRRIFDVKRDKIKDPAIADLIKEQEKKEE